MGFEWDPRKAEINLRKHDVSFNEAGTVLGANLQSRFPTLTIQGMRIALLQLAGQTAAGC